ncbi:MAG: hypothetical protein EB043_04405 [Actinobacteria bacterium]|nr:hypothetical protein [Actinomycetota bacterium]
MSSADISMMEYSIAPDAMMENCSSRCDGVNSQVFRFQILQLSKVTKLHYLFRRHQFLPRFIEID